MSELNRFKVRSYPVPVTVSSETELEVTNNGPGDLHVGDYVDLVNDSPEVTVSSGGTHTLETGKYLKTDLGRVAYVMTRPVVQSSSSDPLPTEPLSPDSQWRKPLGNTSGTDVFYDGQSSDICKYVYDKIADERAAGTGPWVATSNSSSYVWIVGEDVPLRKVNVRTDIAAKDRLPLQEVMNAVPIPDDVYTTYTPPDQGEDSMLTIYQPSSDTLWEIFWFRRKDGPGASGTLPGGDPDWLESPYYDGADPDAYGSCHWGGATKNASKSRGVYDYDSWPPWSRPNWGGTAGSHIFTAGLITQAELEAGEITHAIAIDFGRMHAGVITHPAFRSDGLSKDAYAPNYGAHFRIAPEIDLDAISFATPFGKMIAKAIQKYGMIARNQTGGSTTIFCEDPRPSGNPNAFWTDEGAPDPNGWFQGLTPPAALDGIPWSSLLLIEQGKLKTYPTFQVEGELTVYTQGKMLEHLVGKTAWTMPAETYVGLFSAAPNRNGGGTEFSGNGYVRTAVPAANWDVATDNGTTVHVTNNADIAFPAAQADWPVPVAVGLFDAATDGNLLAYGWLPPLQRNVIASGYVTTFAAGGMWFQDLGVSTYPTGNT